MQARLLFLFFTCISLAGFSQDRIYTTMGEEILANIIDVQEQDITFSKPGESSGIVYTLSKSQIDKIVFRNGIEQVFQQGEMQEINAAQENYTYPDELHLTNGDVIPCKIVEKKQYGVNYIPTKDNRGFTEYISNTKVAKIVYANGDVEYISGSSGKKGGERRSPRDFSYLSPHYLSLNIGPAIPFGAFASSDAAGGGGYASVGVNVNADFTYYFFRGMGISLVGGYMYNPYDDASYRSFITSQLPPSATDIRVDVTDWSVGYLLGGIGYYNSFGRFFLDYKALLGAVFATHPKGSASYAMNTDRNRWTYTGSAVGFLFGGYTGFRYYLTRQWSVLGNITIMFSRATFPNIIKKEYLNDELISETEATGSFALNMSWINLAAGVAYTIGK